MSTDAQREAREPAPADVDLAALSAGAVSLRGSWDDLPAAVVAAIREVTGPINGIEPAEHGYSSHVAGTLDTASGRFFVKGLRRENGMARTQQREVAVNPRVVPMGPRLCWHVITDDWDLLGFEHIAGRIADYRPGSPDLPLVAGTIAALNEVTATGLELTPVAERWRDHLGDPADAAALTGDTLLHTDWHHTNLLVTDASAVHVVDWAMATRGAAWIDPACWIVWLAFAGHPIADAEQWATEVPAFRAAPDDAVDIFAEVQARHWQYIADHHPNTMTHSLRDAAVRWAQHRARR
ncbi:aminoglycoside phosphotransferase [Saccharopolyspora phatthalungensis]|uniref:Aminoglycoside phosphotransferase n=1 Tax=Saccharopolyspora phatthalungensis TaxID=664693 RepID=A0A840QIX0_9PSEU|nr:aminoglycoside phosphotransferase [Saccharopolyspora phatthalungensis]MBB5158739.1 hypothetical protein [Saccharopolyspora phatthalungensis]